MRAKFLTLLALLVLSGAALAADPPKKKPLYPPPEQSNTIGVLGAHHGDSGSASSGGSQPPLPQAAPEHPAVESEPPPPAAAPEHFDVQPSQSEGQSRGGNFVQPSQPAIAPTGFLVDHPMAAGLVAGLIGTDLGAKLYGGPMQGDENAALAGFAIRVGAIILVALMIIRIVARRLTHPEGLEKGPIVRHRREPSFDAPFDPPTGRRDPTLRGGRH